MKLFLSRRQALAATLTSLLAPQGALAFGEEGAFHARLLSLKDEKFKQELTATRRWALELTRRTSAPGKLASSLVSPSSHELLAEPFLIWSGKDDPGALSSRALRSLRQYLRMGGVLLVDDATPRSGKFSLGVRRELRRILPESVPVRLPPEHVLFKTFYILKAPYGRLAGPDHIEAILSGKNAQVLLLQHDLLGAMARKGETWALPMEQGSAEAREMALRFAVNIAMYVLCSDYKDDQVHAPFLMRRRHQAR